MHVVILPGLDGTGKMLGSFIKALGIKYSVQVITYPSRDVLSYTELAKFVEDRLPTDKPYVIIAESFSGPIAVKIASLASKHLKAIIFAASFLKNPTLLPKKLGYFAKGLPLKSSAALRLARPFTFGEWSSKNLDRLLVDALEGVSHQVIAARIKDLMRVDELSAFETLQLPMLYLRPTTDRLVSNSTASEMKARNDTLQIQDVEGSHFILQTNKDVCINRISEFLEDNF